MHCLLTSLDAAGARVENVEHQRWLPFLGSDNGPS